MKVSSQTPGRLGMKTVDGWGGGKGEEESRALGPPREATVDIGAMMRKKRSQLLIPTGGSGGGLASSRSTAAPPAQHFGSASTLGLDVAALENPVYSPDDSLARAASKLAGLRALQTSAPRPLAALPARPVASVKGAASRLAASSAPTALASATAGMPTGRAQLAAPPLPQPCESPPVHDVPQRGSQGVEAVQRLSEEDSGELAAQTARQRQRRSVAPSSTQKRFGSWFDGDDKDLEHTLHEYNREAPAPSPRMTRAQRRKSLAVDRFLASDAALAEAVAEARQEEEQGQQQQQEGLGRAAAVDVGEAPQEGQQPKKAPSRRKSMAAAAMQQVAVAVEYLPLQQAQQAQQQRHIESVAAEVDALNAEMCAQLEGMIEDSPEKKPRGDDRSLRDKLLESWDGRTYYERLMQISSQEEQDKEEQQGRQAAVAAAVAGEPRQAAQPAKQRQPVAAVAPAAQATKPATRTPASKAQPAVAAATKAAPAPAASKAAAPAPLASKAAPAPAASKTVPAPALAAARPPPLRVVQAEAAGGSGPSEGAPAGKASLLTPNSQRQKLHDLTTSLGLLKFTTRQRGQQAAATAAAAGEPAALMAVGGHAADHPGSPQAQVAAAAPVALAVASRTPRTRSASPDASPPLRGGAGAGSRQAPADAAAVVAPKTSGKRGSRRGATPLADVAPGTAAGAKETHAPAAAPAAAATAAPGQHSGRVANAGAAGAMHAEVAAAHEMLAAALAEKEELAEQLRGVQAELEAERCARQATQQEVEQLRQDLEQARQEQQEEADASKAAEQRGRQQQAKELADNQAAAAAAAGSVAERAAEADAAVQRWAEAERSMAAILKAVNSGMKAAASGKEESKALADALRSAAAGENAAPGTGSGSGRGLRQSGGGRMWR